MSSDSTLAPRRVRLFKNGRNQAVRIPREFELPGEEAILRRDEAGRLILEPTHPSPLLALLATLKPLPDEDSMPEIAKLPAKPLDV
jgi:antitoxin VapB